MIRAILIVAVLFLVGCGDHPAPRGSAQDLAAGAAARAQSNARAADAAGVEAARLRANADALSAAAKAQPTEERIAAAVAAQVEAASAEAVRDALRKQATEANDQAIAAAKRGSDERAADQAAADTRQWVFICRCIGLGAVAAGALLGGILVWFSGPTLGVPVGGLITGTGLLVVGFGQTVTWLPLVAGAAVAAGVVLWVIVHGRTLAVTASLSQTVDALEGKAKTSVADAKSALAAAVAKSGMAKRIERLRGTWRAPEVPASPAAPGGAP